MTLLAVPYLMQLSRKRRDISDRCYKINVVVFFSRIFFSVPLLNRRIIQRDGLDSFKEKPT